LYKFHHSIHHNEGIKASKDELVVGWGVYEGPLTEQFNCYSYYAHQIEQNNIYLPWSELGKKPFAYYTDKEPNNQKRVNELCKPHTTFRAKFFISFKDITRTDYQKTIQGFLKRWSDESRKYKALCLSPYEDFTAAGEATRKKAPYFLINVAGRKEISESHKKLKDTKYFDNFSKEERKKLKV
jgi:hypothetical protein